MVPAEFYGDIQHFLLHKFENTSHALVYVHYIHHRVIDGVLLDCGRWHHEFTGVECLKRLVGRVTVGVGTANKDIYCGGGLRIHD